MRASEWVYFFILEKELWISPKDQTVGKVLLIEMKNLKISQIKPDLSWVSTTMLSAARRSFTTPEWPKRIWYKNLNIHACLEFETPFLKCTCLVALLLVVSDLYDVAITWSNSPVESDRPDQACAWSSSPVKKGLTDLVRQVPGSAALWSLTDLVRLVPGQEALWTGVWPTWRG